MAFQAESSQSIIPVVLTIAGSDNSGGAGIQADLKTMTTFRVFGTTAVTCVVAEHPGRVLSIEPIPANRVEEQIRLVFEAFPVAAIKTGMLYSTEIIETVARVLLSLDLHPPLVIDPVMVASSGAPLLQQEAIAAIQKLLLPRATVVTPNRDEAELLSGQSINSLESLRRAASTLSMKYGVPFLVKGGHLRLSQALDVLAIGDELTEFSEPMIPGANPHGTGCTFSAAIASGLARGLDLKSSVGLGKQFITQAIQNRLKLGEYELLNHLPKDGYGQGVLII